MGAFWESWQLWEKMCFVLGAAIILTILAGIGKLIYSHWKLRKYSKAIVGQSGAGYPQMAQKRRGRADSDIPFGIRAIESGVEVEGVWISRNNSPNNSSPGSPALTTIDRSSPRSRYAEPTSNIPTIVMPTPAHPYSSQSSSKSSRTGSIADGLHQTRVDEDETLSSRNVSPPGSYRMSRPSYKPRNSSHLRFSSGAIQPEDIASESDPLQSSKSSRTTRSPSGSSTDSNESVSPPKVPHVYQPRRVPSYSNSSIHLGDARRSEVDLLPFTRHSGADLNALASHRRSHAAEIGQLLPPRSRTSSTEWSSTRSTSRQSIAEEVLTSEPAMTPKELADPFGTPTQRHATLQDLKAPSFQSFLATDPLHSERQTFSTPTEYSAYSPTIQSNSTSPALRPAADSYFPPASPVTGEPQDSTSSSGKPSKLKKKTRARKNSLFTEAV